MHHSVMFSVAETGQKNEDYRYAEQRFVELLLIENLDEKLQQNPLLSGTFSDALENAIANAYSDQIGDQAAHLFLQRILYRINRLNLFWYDDLRHYINERSLFLAKVRDRIEQAWQKWEIAQVDIAALQQLDVKQALTDRAQVDLDPPLSANSQYIREEMTKLGYCHLLAIGSFDGLVEGSRLSRILGGAANEVQCTLVKVLLEEYGNGRLPRKHSTFFAQMLSEFGMDTTPEGYFELVPWEVLACANHNFLLTERKRHFLRYSGGLTYFEIGGPAAYRNYLRAAQRLGLSEAAMGYWDLHIREDERHGQWMLESVAIPLAEAYPQDAWELILGYDQEKSMGDRAADAIVYSIRQVE